MGNAGFAEVPEVARPCVECGYDLRASSGARCPECGTANVADAPHVPWLARGERGRVRAFWLTVRVAMRYPGRLFRDSMFPVDDLEARRFQRAATVIPALWMGVALWGYFTWWPATRELSEEGPGALYALLYGFDAWRSYVVLPLSLSAAPVWIGVAAGAALWGLPRCSTAIFAVSRERGGWVERGLRAASLSRYASAGAPLVAVGVPLMLWCALLMGVGPWRRESAWKMPLTLGFGVGGAAAIWGLGILFVVPLVLLRRCGAGVGGIVAGAAVMAAQWVGVLGLCAVMVAWFPGYLRAMWPALWH